jgi:hypothetical protein
MPMMIQKNALVMDQVGSCRIMTVGKNARSIIRGKDILNTIAIKTTNRRFSMSYLIYNTETTCTVKQLVSKRSWFTRIFETERGATAYLSRLANQGKIDKAVHAVAEETEFYRNIEKQKTVQSIMNGADVKLGVNTPACCDPSTETYWCM